MASVSTDRVRGVNAGKAIKVPCLTATTAAITLSGEQTIDSIACVEDDRVLVKDQTDTVENGIYDVSTGSWTRSPDWSGAFDVTEGTLVNVNQGTVNAASSWKVSTTGTITPGTTAVTFSVISTSDLSPLEADIAQNTADIASTESDVAALDGRTTTTEGDIVTNTADIATNTADITARDTTITDHEERIASLETATPPPDPDPTDPATWNATLDPNKLVANITVFNYTQEASRSWIIVVDSATVPTPPTGFTPGDWVSTNSVASYAASEDWYFYEYDDVNGVVLVQTVTGEDFVTVPPNDTNGPVWVDGAFTLTAGTNYGDIDWEIVTEPIDSGIGLAAADTYTIISDEDSGSNVIKANFTETSGTINVGPGTYTWVCQAGDEAGNTGASDEATIIIASDSDAGVMGFSGTEFTGAESDGTIAITLTRTGAPTVTGTIDISTLSDTAIDVTNYTEFSGTTVTWTDADVTNKTVNLSVVDASSAFNNQLFIIVDHGSETGDGATVGIESCRVLIDSSVSGVPGWQQEAATGDDLIAIEMESSNNTIVASTDSGPPDRTGDTWAVIGPSDRVSNNNALIPTDVSGEHDFGTDTVLDPLACYVKGNINFTSTGAHYIHMRNANRTSTVGQRGHLALMRPLTSIGADHSGGAGKQLVTLAGNHGLATTNGGVNMFFEGTSAYGSSTGFAINDAATNTFTIVNTGLGEESGFSPTAYAFGDETLLGIYHPEVATFQYTWSGIDSSSNAIEMNIPSTGAWELRYYQQDYQNKPDKLVITTNASYDPDVTDSGDSSNSSLDEAFGVVVSDYAAGSVPIDNPDSTVNLPYPLPAATVNATHILPADGSLSIPTSQQIRVVFEDMTNLELNSVTVKAFDQEITGSTISNTATIIYTPSSQLIESTEYTVSLNGRITDTDGSVKSITTASEPWTFTTVAPPATGDIIFSQNFTGIASTLPYTLTRSDLESAFNERLDAGAAGNACINAGNAVLVDDPFSNSSRGAVMRVIFHKDMYALGKSDIANPIPSGISIYYYLPTPQSEVYCSYSLGLPANFKFHYSTKSCCIQTQPMSASTDPALLGTQMSCRFVYNGNNPQTVPDLPACVIDGSNRLYYYSAVRARGSWYSTDPLAVNPPSQCSQSGDFYPLEAGRWNQIEIHVKNNTVGVGNGEMHLWINNQMVIEKTDVEWISSVEPTQKWERFGVNHYHGGNEQKYAVSETEYIYLDDFIISKSRITG